MKVKELRNDQGLISGLVISADDIKELKTSLKPDSSFFQYVDNLQASLDQGRRDAQQVMSNGFTVAQTNEKTSKVTLDLYRSSFDKNVPIYYRDERTIAPDEFIQANPDGSEDLVKYNLSERTYKIINRLLSKEEGNIYKLLDRQR